ncbi:MAG: shikimate kinase [Sedimentibacter saalensis]|jgi:shikimate kinase|uniref:shikimate kinase n=1 Tax=Sedimentibacter saalensis TaxID=130788 RepID=UPI002B207E20|nr:shikimate kinase [Sedimentibacter saalensis]MEA5095354.1 shikimate kinase [Sedimentibacter saalensis]
MKNIVLIGMPGSGKSTIGLMLSQKLCMKFIDMDEHIEKKEHKTIKELFAISEECFRDAETRCSEEMSKMDSCIISAGGGIIKRKENIDFLKQSSTIVFINRCVEDIVADIDMSTRPLLKDGIKKVYDLYDERIDLYKEYCDIEVSNSGDISEVVQDIIKKVVK